MDGGRLHCLIAFFTCNVLLLLVVCLHDMEAFKCKQQNGKVGETVVLSSDSPTEGITSASWRYNNTVIADKDDEVPDEHPFLGRVNLNRTHFSLMISKLTVDDSGDFNFVSTVNQEQRETVCITLQVQEILSKQPELSIINREWHAANESCTVGLQCSSPSHKDVSYKWTVKNQNQNGSTFHFVFRPQDGDTTITCTIFNSFNEMSASKPIKCDPSVDQEQTSLIILLGAAGGSCLIIVILVGVVCHCKQRRAAAGIESVYEDICDVNDNGTSSTMMPCSLYETINNKPDTVNTVTSKCQTVYDQINLIRMSPGVS